MLDLAQARREVEALGIDVEALFAAFNDEPKLGLAVSGGADSGALCALIAIWKQAKAHPKIIVYSVDHGLRSEAANEVELVKNLADDFGFKFVGLRWSGEKPATGLQAAARKARYEMIAAEMGRSDVPLLLTGHHLQDQAETVLMRMAHGSGLTGLKGMQPFASVYGARVARPLLGVSKEQLLNVVKVLKIDFVNDPSNDDEAYERVRWRNILPQLAELGLTPERLCRIASRTARADNALAAAKSNAIVHGAFLNQFGGADIELEVFLGWSTEIQVRVLQHFLDVCGGAGKDADLEQVERLAQELNATKAFKRSLGGCVVEKETSRLCIFREAGRMRAHSGVVQAGGIAHWDQRYFVSNRSAEDYHFSSAKDVSRNDAEAFLGCHVEQPMDRLAASLLIKNQADQIVSLGLVTKNSDIMVQSAVKLPPFLAQMI